MICNSNLAFAILGFLATAQITYATPLAEPIITPFPLLPRADDDSFFGYTLNGPTWTPISCEVGYTFTSSSTYARCCATGAACLFYTGCTGSTIAGPDTTRICPTFSTCSFDVLFASVNARTSYRSYWCDNALLETGGTYYRENPTATRSPASSTSDKPSTPTPTPTETEPSSGGGGGSKNVGAIAGGTVGGLAVVSIAGFTIVWLLLRHRRKVEKDRRAAAHASVASTSQWGGSWMPPPSGAGAASTAPMMNPGDDGSRIVSGAWSDGSPLSAGGQAWAQQGGGQYFPPPQLPQGGYAGQPGMEAVPQGQQMGGYWANGQMQQMPLQQQQQSQQQQGMGGLIPPQGQTPPAEEEMKEVVTSTQGGDVPVQQNGPPPLRDGGGGAPPGREGPVELDSRR